MSRTRAQHPPIAASPRRHSRSSARTRSRVECPRRRGSCSWTRRPPPSRGSGSSRPRRRAARWAAHDRPRSPACANRRPPPPTTNHHRLPPPTTARRSPPPTTAQHLAPPRTTAHHRAPLPATNTNPQQRPFLAPLTARTRTTHPPISQIPEGVAYDANGEPTTDPSMALKGALRTFDRGYK